MSSPFSVSFWINSTSAASGPQMIVGKDDGNGDDPGWSVFTEGGCLYFLLNSGGSQLEVSQAADFGSGSGFNTDICDGVWRHVVVTYDGSLDAGGVAIYVDNAAQALDVVSNSLLPTTGGTSAGDIVNGVDATIGAASNGSDGFCGGLQEMTIFDRALTTADVNTLYAGGSGVCGAAGVSGLLAGYHFDEGSGTTINDFSGNGNTGALVGDVTWPQTTLAAHCVVELTTSSVLAGSQSITAVYSYSDGGELVVSSSAAVALEVDPTVQIDLSSDTELPQGYTMAAGTSITPAADVGPARARA